MKEPSNGKRLRNNCPNILINSINIFNTTVSGQQNCVSKKCYTFGKKFLQFLMTFYLLLSIELISISFIFTEHISDVTKFGADIKGVTKSTKALKKSQSY